MKSGTDRYLQQPTQQAITSCKCEDPMSMNSQIKRSTDDKIRIFRSLFTGRTDVYGTYDLKTGRAWQVKAPVTKDVILAHLKGQQPYGFYMLTGDRTCILVIDYDKESIEFPINFILCAKNYDIQCYLERSKSKGYHVWVFFEENGVSAAKARLIAREILNDTHQVGVEVFPKQDALDQNNRYGNFINAPLFGALVPDGKTVFIKNNGSLEPYPNQWDLLESVKRVSEKWLDDLIEMNNFELSQKTVNDTTPKGSSNSFAKTYGLPPCSQRILKESVVENQRMACFRLGVHLKNAGIPFDIAVAALKAWAVKNKPIDGRRIITEREIKSHAGGAYSKDYTSYGCEDPAIQPYCNHECPIYKKHHNE